MKKNNNIKMSHDANLPTENETLFLQCGSDNSVTYLRFLCTDISEHPTDISHSFWHSNSPHPDLCNKTEMKLCQDCYNDKLRCLLIESVPQWCLFPLSLLSVVLQGFVLSILLQE